jgi:hypothetical protein
MEARTHPEARHPAASATLEALRAASASLSSADLQRREPGKWSVEQIYDHLEKPYSSTAYILGRCAEQGVAKGGRPTLKNRIQAFVVTSLGYFPTGVASPEVAIPAASPAPGAVERAVAALLTFDRAAAAAEARLGPRARVANHPIMGPFTVNQWRRFHLFHTRHHMKQVRAIRIGARS